MPTIINQLLVLSIFGNDFQNYLFITVPSTDLRKSKLKLCLDQSKSHLYSAKLFKKKKKKGNKTK